MSSSLCYSSTENLWCVLDYKSDLNQRFPALLKMSGTSDLFGNTFEPKYFFHNLGLKVLSAS